MLRPQRSPTQPGAPAYAPRHPEQTLLYSVVREQLETFLAHARECERPVPRFVERELRRYLECGILAHGFVRVRCEACGHDRMRFHPLPPPDDAEVARVARQVARGIARRLERQGLGPEADAAEADPLAAEEPLLADLYAASVQGGSRRAREPASARAVSAIASTPTTSRTSPASAAPASPA